MTAGLWSCPRVVGEGLVPSRDNVPLTPTGGGRAQGPPLRNWKATAGPYAEERWKSRMKAATPIPHAPFNNSAPTITAKFHPPPAG